MTEKVNLGERFFWHFWHFWHFWQELRKDLILLKGFSPSSPSTWIILQISNLLLFCSKHTHTQTKCNWHRLVRESFILWHLLRYIFPCCRIFTKAIAHSSRVFSILSKVDRSSFHFSSVHNSKFLSAVWKLFSLQSFSATAAYTIHMLCPCIYSSCKLNLCEAHNVRQSHFSCQKIMVFTKITKI